ncbi:MAG TPA: M23 family metallopeptidase [Bryobacteraceae bacterium]|nr:M23 family metallopeptidase [Bryobacteraceae bacterium]
MNKILAALIILVLAGGILLVVISQGTTLKVEPVKAIGMATPVKVHVANTHGVRRLAAYVEQDGARHTLFEQAQPARRLFFWRGSEAPKDVTFEAGKAKAPALKDGKARLVIEAVSNDLRARTDQVSYDVQVATQPPRVVADGFQHYINQGGMELVVFTPSGYWTEAGVKVGKYTFRSFPLPGGAPGERFAMFAYPWDLGPDEAPYVYATNPTGTLAKASFWYKVFPKKFRVRDFELNDAFLDKVVNQIEPAGTGQLIDRYLKINRDLRRQNNQTLADLRFKTEEKMFWDGPFARLGKEESMFADVRNYIYQGKKVDQQVHLGYDLSDVQQAPVSSSNNGRVVYAADLGIYGNCVVVDHGYGLQSIYGHLSRIEVKPGDLVKKGQILGRSGSTGLAGGDHLHYSMQIDGVQINPMEWWDILWLRDRIQSKLKPVAQAAAAQ